MTEREERVTRLSYSALSSYAECGERFRLERLYGIKSGTWWVTLAGSAGHTVTELFDRGELAIEDMEDAWVAEFAKEEAKAVEEGREIRASGRMNKTGLSKSGGPNKKDKDWCLHFFPGFVQNYVDWRLATGWEIWSDDEHVGIELPIDAPMADENFKGFVDRVFVVPTDFSDLTAAVLRGGDEVPDTTMLVCVDLKFGNTPSSSMQLGTYRVGLLKQYGIDMAKGTYFMAADGKPTSLTDLSRYTPEFIEAQYEMAWRGIRAGVFLPNVSSFCNSCGVREYCRAYGGQDADRFPLLEVDQGMPDTLA